MQRIPRRLIVWAQSGGEHVAHVGIAGGDRRSRVRSLHADAATLSLVGRARKSASSPARPIGPPTSRRPRKPCRISDWTPSIWAFRSIAARARSFSCSAMPYRRASAGQHSVRAAGRCAGLDDTHGSARQQHLPRSSARDQGAAKIRPSDGDSRRSCRDRSTCRPAAYFSNNNFYAFFWTNHCVLPGVLTPDPGAPLTLPPPKATCAENRGDQQRGAERARRTRRPQIRCVFRQTDPPEPLLLQNPLRHMPSGFVYVSAAQTAPRNRRRPPARGQLEFRFSARRDTAPAFPIWRSRRARRFGDPQTWSLLCRPRGGNPVWITRAQWESGHNASGEWVPPRARKYTTASPRGTLRRRAFGDMECAAPHLATALQLRQLEYRSAVCERAVGTVVAAHRRSSSARAQTRPSIARSSSA